MPTNILLIMADQLRADALACNGNPVIDTPNLDRLARTGVNCTACYTPAPICVPARAALATGCYPHRCTGTKNNEGAILPGLPLLPAELAATGYRTYATGKLHYLPYRAPGEPRVTHGFQVSEVAESGRALRKWDPEGRLRGLEDYLDYLHEVGWGGYSRANGLGNNDVFASASAMPAEHYVDAWVATRAIHHLDRHLDEHRDQPFFLFASFPKPHTAFDPPRPFDARYDPRQMPDPVGSVELLAERGLTAFASRPAEYEWNEFSPEAMRTIKAHYYGLVTFQDLQVGRLLDFLEERGLREDTLVVFTADHGEMLGDFGQYLKESFYEGSARVPLIASHPGTLPEGRRDEGLVGLHDLMPTLLAAAGAPVPAGIDGLDLSAMLRGGGPVRKALVAQCHDAPRQQYMVRDARWKYLYHQDGAVEELFDLNADPHELRDLSGTPDGPAASARRSMRAFLIDWCRRHGDHGMLDGDDLAAADPRPQILLKERSLAHHSVVYHDPTRWAATPANNGGNGPTWQWGDEFLIGFTRGTFLQADKGHQCTYDQPFESHLARSTDGGESWTTWQPAGYAGNLNPAEPRQLRGGLDFSGEGFVLRAEGAGYHGNRAARWFHSDDRGASWHGPHAFIGLLDHPELAGKEFTARTSYVVDGPNELSLFLTVRRRKEPHELGISLQEKTFLARTDDGGATFSFVAWAVPWDDPYRAAMPAPARLSDSHLIVAVRRKSEEHNWLDCFHSADDGATWSYRSQITRTEVANEWNGNPPALIRMGDGPLCAVYGNRTARQMQARYSGDDGATWSAPQELRDDFQSANGFPDLGYPRLFQRPDGRLVTAYFWCTAERPQTHIAATIFRAPER